MTSDELKQSVVNGDLEKQEFMRNLILAIPYHSDEISLLENLALKKATTMQPSVEPTVPKELKDLLKNHGVLKGDDKSIGIVQLPDILPHVDHPTSLLINKQKNYDLLPTFDAKVYEAFKPLSVEKKKNISDELELILKQFGLNNSTSEKSAKKNPQNSSMIDSAYLTPNYKNLLDSIGIQTSDIKFEYLKQDINEAKKINSQSQRNGGSYKNFSTLKNVYDLDPVAHQQVRGSASTKKEVKRQPQTDEPTKVSLNEKFKPLLESSLEATDDDTSSFSSSGSTSSPSTTTSTTTTTIRTTTSEAPSSTTQEAKKNTLEDEIEPIDDIEIEPLPSPRRSGFYMIFDWNTFLEVGEDPEKIVVRFNPKVGDATRFLPVTVP